MARRKGRCSKCSSTTSLLFDDNDDELAEFDTLKKGEYFEHKCPVCGEWSAFEVVED